MKNFIRATLSLMTIVLSMNIYSDDERSDDDFRRRAIQIKRNYDEADILTEVEFGRNLAARILGKYNLVQDLKITNYVSKIGKGIAAQSGRPELQFHFAVLDTDDVNAYACPGGYIFITKGALAGMKDEAQLAGVISHEIAHVNQRHVVNQLNIKSKDSSLSSGVAGLVGGTTASGKVAFEQVMDQAVKILFENGIEKKDEFEADALAVKIVSSIGYDWHGYMDYIKGLQESIVKGKGAVISKTHPSSQERLNALNAVVSSNGLEGFNGKKNVNRFNQNTAIRG